METGTDSTPELTIEQKAKLYDALKTDHQALLLMACKLIDDFRHACYNGFNRKFKTKDGKDIETFGKDFDKIADELRHADGDNQRLAWELAEIFRALDKFGVHFDKVGEKGPIEAQTLTKDVMDCKKMAEEVAYHKELTSGGFNTIEKFREKFSADDAALAYKAMIFYYEYRFGHVYPGDENSIYQDAYRSIMLPLMARAGCLPDKDSMLKWMGDYQQKHSNAPFE